MDATRNANTLTNLFFATNGLDYRITDSDTKYASNTRKKAYQEEVKKWLETQYAYRKIAMNLHKRDIQAWKEALAYYEEIPTIPPKTSWIHKFLNRIWTFA